MQHLLRTALFLFFIAPTFIVAQSKNNFFPDEILVQFRSTQASQQFLQEIAPRSTRFAVTKIISKPLNIFLLKTKYGESATFLAWLRRQPQVEIAQWNHRIKSRNTIPNDTLFAKQWQWLNIGGNNGTADADIDADQAWDITTGGVSPKGDTIVIAVIDDGIDDRHIDLKENMWVNRAEIPSNGIDDDGNGFVDDFRGWNTFSDNDNVNSNEVSGSRGHATEVAGMIGAKGNNKTGITGLNWNIKLMNIVGGSRGDEAGIIEAYSYALTQRLLYQKSGGQKGAFVVATNSSFGISNAMPEDVPLWCNFYDSLGVHGILSCGAAPNTLVNVDEVGDIPTNCDSNYFVGVTSTTNTDNLAIAGYGLKSIDVGAPGDNIYTTINNNGYRVDRGASFSTPIVTALVGLLYAAPCTNLTDLAKIAPATAALQVRRYILNGVDKVSNLQNRVSTGGRLNAYNSLKIILAECLTCPSPAAVKSQNITDKTATIVWANYPSTSEVKLRWRKVGTTNFTEIEQTTLLSSYTITNLEPCRNYEFQVQSICQEEKGQNTVSYFFKTDGCCSPPSDININNIGKDSIRLQFKAVLIAKNYQIRYRRTNSTTWNMLLTNESTQKLTNLTACTDYELQIQTLCGDSTAAFTPSIFFKTQGCGACTDLIYCKTTTQGTDSEWIKKVSLKNFTKISGASAHGFEDFTALSNINLTLGSTYEILLKPAFKNFRFDEYFRVWIDYNQDGDFDDANELALDPGHETSDSIRALLTIPNTAKEGSTRMRVVMRYFTRPENVKPLPCENPSGFGEIEDYCINLAKKEGNCPNIMAFDTTQIGRDKAKLTWLGNINANNYEVWYRPTGTMFWQTINTNKTTLELNNLIRCTNYEAQLRPICDDDSGGASRLLKFKTLCPTPIAETKSDSFSYKVFPNPYLDIFNISFSIFDSNTIEIEIYDITGKLIANHPKQLYNPGEHIIPFSIQAPQGVYLLKIKTNKTLYIEKIIKN